MMPIVDFSGSTRCPHTENTFNRLPSSRLTESYQNSILTNNKSFPYKTLSALKPCWFKIPRKKTAKLKNPRKKHCKKPRKKPECTSKVPYPMAKIVLFNFEFLLRYEFLTLLKLNAIQNGKVGTWWLDMQICRGIA